MAYRKSYLPHPLRNQCHFVELAAAHTKVADVQTRRRQRRRPRVDPPEAVLARPGVRMTAARHDRHGLDGTRNSYMYACSTNDEANRSTRTRSTSRRFSSTATNCGGAFDTRSACVFCWAFTPVKHAGVYLPRRSRQVADMAATSMFVKVVPAKLKERSLRSVV